MITMFYNEADGEKHSNHAGGFQQLIAVFSLFTGTKNEHQIQGTNVQVYSNK